MAEHVLVSKEDRVLRLTLNRPEKRNALTSAMCRALVDALESARDDRHVGCVLLAAAGDAFSAGMDLDESIAPDAAEKTEIHEALFTIGARYSKPIVAAVKGPALGGGFGLLVNAHVAIAAHGGNFGVTEIRLGMWPFVIWRAVAAALGDRRALELALTGRIFGVHEALAWGLVHEAVPPFELDDRATAVAANLSMASPEAVKRGLEYFERTRHLSYEESGRLSRQLRAELFAGADFHEGVAAFKEHRRPEWPSIPTAED